MSSAPSGRLLSTQHGAKALLIGKALLLGAALFMVCARFVGLERTPFLADEPIILGGARAIAETGVWPLASPAQSATQGVVYGPLPVWFYGLVHMVFGSGVKASIVAMGIALTTAQLALAFAFARVFGRGSIFLATIVAWMASSPYQFLWSRLAWDNTMVNISACWAVVLLCSAEDLRPRTAAALGVLLGIGLSSHLMFIPVVLAIFLALAIEMKRKPAHLLRTGAWVAATTACTTLPYVVHLLRTPAPVRSSSVASFYALGEYLIQPARVGTLWGVDYFFDESWEDFRTWLGSRAMLLDAADLTLIITSLVSAFGIAWTLRSTNGRLRRIGLLATLVFAFAPAFYALRSLSMQPHYQQPTWWIVLFGIGGALAWTDSRRASWVRPAAYTIVWCVALSQFLFIGDWMRYVGRYEGTRGAHYSSPLGAQLATIHAICAFPEAVIRVENRTLVRATTLSYLGSTETECLGKRIVFCDSNPCDPTSEGARRVRLRYRNDKGGGLLVE